MADIAKLSIHRDCLRQLTVQVVLITLSIPQPPLKNITFKLN